MLHDDSVPVLRPEWVLRNDGRKVILYLMSNREIRFLILDPVTAVLVALLDGRHTVKDLVATIQVVFNLGSVAVARNLLEQVIAAVNHDGEKISVLPQLTPRLEIYDPVQFIIPPAQFDAAHHLSVPLSLLIYFSAWCQTTCRYCYADLANMRRLNHLSIEQWLPILSEARDLDIRLIQLSGGDPLGRHQSIDFITQLIKFGFLFMISTKCYVHQAAAEQLVAAGFNQPVNGVQREFQFSVDSADPEVAAFLVGRKGYPQRAAKTIANLQRAGIAVRAKAVVTPFNYRHLRDYVATFAELGTKQFQFSIYARSFHRHDDILFMTDEMKAQTAETLQAIAQEYPELTIEGDARRFVPQSSIDPDQRRQSWNQRSGCSAGRTNLGIAPDGHALLCEQMPLIDTFFVGDLAKQSIQEVWNSAALREFTYPAREKFAGTLCYDCADFERCVVDTGHCFRDSFFVYNNLYCPPPKCPHVVGETYRMM